VRWGEGERGESGLGYLFPLSPVGVSSEDEAKEKSVKEGWTVYALMLWKSTNKRSAVCVRVLGKSRLPGLRP
jgi:hypothetical protein